MIQNAEEFFRILDRLGLNFDAINLKFLQIVGNIPSCLQSVKIDILQIKIRKNLVSLQKFFHILDQLGLGEIVI